MYGDLCEENKITAYPQLNLYRDGEFVDTFSGTRDYDVLQDYIKKHAEPTLPSASMTIPVAVEAPTMTKPEEVLHVQTSRADVNPSGSVLPLGPSNFQEVIDQGPAFIKFFAPWYVLVPRKFLNLDGKIQVWTLQETCTDLDSASSPHAT